MKRYATRLLAAILFSQIALLALIGTDSVFANEPEPVLAGDAIDGDPFADIDLFSEDLTGGNESEQEDEMTTLDLHGYLESRNQFRINKSDFMSTRQRLWLELDGGYGTGDFSGAEHPLRIFASGAMDFDPAAASLSDDHPTIRAGLEETYVTIDRDKYNVIVGRKIHRIGTGDGVNPMDLINPLDYRDPVASGRADSREPVPLAMATFDLPTPTDFQEASLEAIIVPLAQVNQFNSPGSPWEPAGLKMLRQADSQGLFVLDSQDKPTKAFEEAEYMLRLSGTVSGWDLSLIGFYGFLDSPVLTGNQQPDGLGGTELHVTPVHPSYTAFGASFAKGLERSTIRGEIALKPNIPLQKAGTEFDYTRTALVEGVLGIDRTFGVNFYTNLQYFFTQTNNADKVTSRSFSHGVTYEIHDKFLYDDLTLGIRGLLGFSEQGWTLENYAEYSLADDWKMEASVLFFEGPQKGQYGQFGDNDSLKLRIRYSF